MAANYQRADFSPLRDGIYGVAAHWTTWTAPASGTPRAFPDAVAHFDVPGFVKDIVATGASHAAITLSHALQWLPCPHPVVEKILPGRTCRRDLVGEIADALASEGVKLMLYYHHDLDAPDLDPEWRRATGADEPGRHRFYQNLCGILKYLGEQYGKRTMAYWFDAGWALAADPKCPWADITAAAKAGNPNRLVTYNASIDSLNFLTEYQDYFAGETEGFDLVPNGPVGPGGLPWHCYGTWYRARATAAWGIEVGNENFPRVPPTPDTVVEWIEKYRAVGGAVTLNALIHQEGRLYPPDIAVMRGVKERLR